MRDASIRSISRASPVQFDPGPPVQAPTLKSYVIAYMYNVCVHARSLRTLCMYVCIYVQIRS